MGLRAIIYVRTMADLTWCARWCEHRGYRITEVINDPSGDAYPGVRGRLLAGEADVLVVRALAELPHRLPRLEEARDVVDEPVDVADEQVPSRRRPRPLR